jgi:hypothetical protein
MLTLNSDFMLKSDNDVALCTIAMLTLNPLHYAIFFVNIPIMPPKLGGWCNILTITPYRVAKPPI